MELHTIAHLSAEEKKALFASATITHRQLEAVHERIRRAIRQPAGFSFVLVHGPTGVGKTQMMESLAVQARKLLRRVPLECPAERWVADHWLYFYECSIGCIGLLKDWLLRAVSTALDDGKNRLSLDCVQDRGHLSADGSGCLRRGAATEPHRSQPRTCVAAVARWRTDCSRSSTPPREVPDVVEPSSSVKSAQPGEQLGNGAVPPAPLDEAPLPTPPVKKTRTRKKAVTVPAESTNPGPVIQVETSEPPAIIPAKRGRKKKTGGDEALAAKEQEAKSPSESPGQPSPVSTEADVVSAPTKPKRTRRVGEPKAKRYPVGEPEAEQGA